MGSPELNRGKEDYQQAEWLSAQKNIQNTWRYDHTANQWHHWDGIRWAPDKVRSVNRAVKDAVVNAITNNRSDDNVMKLLSIPAQERALTALSSLEGYGTDGDDWDSDPYTLGVKNGIVDLRTNTLIETPTSDNLVTKTTDVKFVPITSPSEFHDRAPDFMKAMDEWTSSDASMTSFLLLWFGASMFGMAPEQRFLLMTGVGRNGKGALKHSIMRAVGEYGAQFDANLYMRSKFGASRSDGARADLIALKGKRITFFSEPEGNRFNEELLKAHTGGDEIVARALYSNNIQTWSPTHSITFLVNDAPEVEDLGPSMAARVMVADFRERFDGDKENKQLYSDLEKERVGILAILCWAASAWYQAWSSGKGGITMPERVQEQSRAFMERNDPIANYIDEACNVGQGLVGNGQLLYDAYKDWHDHSGRDDDYMSNVRFAAMLEKKGFRKHRTNRGVQWLNIKPKGATELAYGDESDD